MSKQKARFFTELMTAPGGWEGFSSIKIYNGVVNFIHLNNKGMLIHIRERCAAIKSEEDLQ